MFIETRKMLRINARKDMPFCKIMLLLSSLNQLNHNNAVIHSFREPLHEQGNFLWSIPWRHRGLTYLPTTNGGSFSTWKQHYPVFWELLSKQQPRDFSRSFFQVIRDKTRQFHLHWKCSHPYIHLWASADRPGRLLYCSVEHPFFPHKSEY